MGTIEIPPVFVVVLMIGLTLLAGGFIATRSHEHKKIVAKRKQHQLGKREKDLARIIREIKNLIATADSREQFEFRMGGALDHGFAFGYLKIYRKDSSNVDAQRLLIHVQPSRPDPILLRVGRGRAQSFGMDKPSVEVVVQIGWQYILDRTS